MGRLNALKRLIIDCSLNIRSLSISRDPYTWVFGEWTGKRCGDNSTILANYVAKNHKEIKVYWIAYDGSDTSLLFDGVTVLTMDSPDARKILLIAGAAFMTHDMRDFSSKGYNYLAGAFIVQLWHGIAWKYIGMDAIAKKSIPYKLYYRLLYKMMPSDLYIVPSEDYATYMKTAFLAKDYQLLRTGYPRNSVLFNKKSIHEIRDFTKKKLNASLGLNIRNETKVIVYLPTFRDKVEVADSFESLLQNKNSSFFDWLLYNDVVILHKAHFVDQESHSSNSIHSKLYNCNQFSALELMCLSDLLITDYSSCFFDYLILDKPIIHYIYDYDYYSSEDRGLYYRWEDVACGDVAFNIDELQKMIIKNITDSDSNKALREKRRKQYITYENPNSCEQIFNVVLKRLNVKE